MDTSATSEELPDDVVLVVADEVLFDVGRAVGRVPEADDVGRAVDVFPDADECAPGSPAPCDAADCLAG